LIVMCRGLNRGEPTPEDQEFDRHRRAVGRGTAQTDAPARILGVVAAGGHAWAARTCQRRTRRIRRSPAADVVI